MNTVWAQFNLAARVAIVTGGCGLLGRKHAEALHAMGAYVVILDLQERDPWSMSKLIGENTIGCPADVRCRQSLEVAREMILGRFGRIDILVNNAACNPQPGDPKSYLQRLETMPVSQWNDEVSVGLTGMFLCAQVFGQEMTHNPTGGVIVNIASDLALVAPDQRIYREEGESWERQYMKPPTYCAIKAGVLGLTKYLATYWAHRNIRVNALCPGGVENGQSPEFIKRKVRTIPLGRMARSDEYQGALVFLCSDASSYMTGSTLVVDGGMTAW